MSFRLLRSLAILILLLAVPISLSHAQSAPTGSETASTSVSKTGQPKGTDDTSSGALPANNSPSSADASKQAKAATEATNKVAAAVTNTVTLRTDAEKLTKELKSILEAVPKRTVSSLEDLQTIQSIVAAVQRMDLLNALSKAKASLDANSPGSLEKSRNTECGKLQQFASLKQQDVIDAQSKCADTDKQTSDTASALGSSDTDLRAALGGVFSYTAQKVGELKDKLKPLSDLQPGSTTPELGPLLRTLPRALPALKQVLENQQEFQVTWNSTAPLLKQLNVSPPTPEAGSTPAPSVDDAFKSLATAVETILLHLDPWFNAIATALLSSAKTLDSTLSDVLNDPAKNSASAVGTVRDLTDTLGGAQPIVDAWPALVGLLVDGKPPGFDLKATKTNLETLQSALNTLRGAVSRMHDALAGNLNQFDTAQVSLYYFTDIQRLMRALNENTRTVGGVAEAQSNAAAQRTTLTQAELDLADSQATVNRLQKEVLDLQEQKRQVQAKLKGFNADVSKLANRLKGAQDAKDSADANYQKAKSNQDAAPSDPTKASALQEATAKQTAATTKLSQAQSDHDSAKSERDTTQSQLDNTQNQSDSIPARLATAQQALSGAQTAVSKERRRMLLAAQAESDAFAFARDNTPYLFAPADASSSDPAKRVILYAFNDNKTIFMRGMSDDLAVVKHIIAEFDRPAPQARLTLWTFQLNSETGQKTNKRAAERLNKSMEIIDEQLGDSRALVNTTLSLLRDLINEQVGAYVAPVLTTTCPNCNAADLQKLGRLNFYDPEVLTQLNFNLTSVDLNLLRRLVPDPAGTTTLGEALLILSLARPEIKVQVRKDFEDEIKDLLGALPLSNAADRSTWEKVDSVKLMPLTWHAMGVWEDGYIGYTGGLTSSQLEICRALRTSFDYSELRQIADKLESWFADLNSIDPRLDELRMKIGELEDRGKTHLNKGESDKLSDLQKKLKRNGDDENKLNELIRTGINALPRSDISDYDQMDGERLDLESRQLTIWNQSVEVVHKLKSYGVDLSDLTQFTPGTTGDKTFRKVLSGARILILKAPGLNGASPRVAAADQMLKEMIIALEDDLARLFIQPMIRGLRIRLTSESQVSVGIIQRESLLATNRGKARIDPRASAQLAVGTEIDILASVQQLAQLYAVVQSGGALAALGALQSQPREPQPEITALTTGNKFEVTPIFDPSGQALRFKFDFVSSSNLQEPNGSTNPQFPRIERHTVNTEVQLSNLEIREISRFESNARLGRPTQYWGGLPILKDIPGVRPWIPLVGWFVRKAGSNAVAQQSVIFGQTTVYPTIGTLIDLLASTEPEAVPESQIKRKHHRPRKPI